MHSTDPALPVLGSLLPISAPFCSCHSMYRPCSYLLGSLVHILVPFCSLYAFHRPCSYSLGSLLHMSAPLYSFYVFHRPCSHSLGILVPFCSLYAFHRSCSLESLMHIISPLHSFLHSKELGLTLSCHLSTSLLHSALLRNLQTLYLLWTVISSHPSSIMLFLCNLQTMLLLIRVIIAHPSSILLYLFAFHRPCSYSLGSLFCIPAPFCSFFAIYRPCS